MDSSRTFSALRMLVLGAAPLLWLGRAEGQGAAGVPGVASGGVVPSPTPVYVLKDFYEKREVMIPMRDGVRLFTVIYSPRDTSKKYPFLVTRDAYGVRPYGPDNYRGWAGAYVDFLQALATRWTHFDSFYPTLAISGDMAGSLRHRMLGADTVGRVYAKTGNIAGVVTLAGYVEARSGTRYAFVILANGGCAERSGHAWQDRLLIELARNG